MAADGNRSDSASELPTAANMFARLFAGQQKLAQDIAEIDLFHQPVINRFGALESRVAALGSFAATSRNSGASGKDMYAQLQSLTVVSRLVRRLGKQVTPK